MKPTDFAYLGDGCYCRFDGFQFWLVTGSHDNPDNEVALDDYTLTAFLNFIEKTKKIKIKIENFGATKG